MNPHARKPEEMTLGQLLTEVARLTGDRLRIQMKQIGLHRAQAFALFCLWHHDGLAQNELARRIHVTPAAVTPMLQRMERDGWVERRTDPDDQRISRVYMTEKAGALRRQATTIFRELDAEVAGALSTDEQAVLRELLMKVHAEFRRHMPPLHQHRFGWLAGEGDAEEGS
ncbi:MAG: MarR family transcriptional regulator [Candidatus Bipolaricaulis sp.]|nr:MarR family transcriptional regulator [Candidatus Bipolaricaulis sp.]